MRAAGLGRGKAEGRHDDDRQNKKPDEPAPTPAHASIIAPAGGKSKLGLRWRRGDARSCPPDPPEKQRDHDEAQSDVRRGAEDQPDEGTEAAANAALDGRAAKQLAGHGPGNWPQDEAR